MGLDSVELVMSIEEEFGLDIPDAVAEKIKTVGDLVDHLAQVLEAKGLPADREDIFQRVRRRTLEFADVRPEDVVRSTRFVRDLGIN